MDDDGNGGFIIDAKQKMLDPPDRPKSQIARNLKINTKNPRYIEYKKGDSTL